MSSFEGRNIQAHVLSYRIDLYFHGYKLAIKFDENSHRNRNLDYEVKRQKRIEHELGCKFIRIDLDKEVFDIFRTIDVYQDTSNNRLKSSKNFSKTFMITV